MKIISINNNKGGVLKTTLATNIAGYLSKNNKVLLVDLDPQGNVCSAFGQNSEQLKWTLAEVLFDKIPFVDVILQNVTKNLDILPSNQNLGYFDSKAFEGSFGKEPSLFLANLIKKIGKSYKYVVIDTAPYMNLLTLSSFKAANEILIPTQTEIFSIKGLVDLTNQIKQSVNNPKISVIPTLFVSNSNLHKQIMDSLKTICKNNKINLSKTIITKSVQASNSFAFDRVPLVLTNSKSKQKQQLVEIGKEFE